MRRVKTRYNVVYDDTVYYTYNEFKNLICIYTRSVDYR